MFPLVLVFLLVAVLFAGCAESKKAGTDAGGAGTVNDLSPATPATLDELKEWLIAKDAESPFPVLSGNKHHFELVEGKCQPPVYEVRTTYLNIDNIYVLLKEADGIHLLFDGSVNGLSVVSCERNSAAKITLEVKQEGKALDLLFREVYEKEDGKWISTSSKRTELPK
jgi:hypothetical protein